MRLKAPPASQSGHEMSQDSATSEFKETPAMRLRWLMFFRVVFATILLVGNILIQLRQPGGFASATLAGLYSLIVGIYLLTFVYALILPRIFPQTIQAYFQSFGDVVITTAIIYLTGGIDSIFSFMYILAIIMASMVLYRKGAIIIAAFSTIAYGLILDLHFYQKIIPLYTYSGLQEHYLASEVLYQLLINMCAFFLVAYLSGYFAQQAEETRRRLLIKESDLERLEGLNESIIQSIDTGLMTLGAEGEILSCNPAGERITGYRFLQIQGRPYHQLFPALNLRDFERSSFSPVQPVTFTYDRRDGQTLFLEMAPQHLKDRSELNLEWLLVFQDKSRIHQMEEEVKRVEKLAAVGEVAASIAHEIRTPLASVSGSIQLLESELKANSEQDPLMRIIRREMERLENVVQDFLLFARPKTGNPACLALYETVRQIVYDFTQQEDRSAKRITVITDIQDGLSILFDHYQFEQVLWNLLSNASEAMDQGGDILITAEKDE
ncbi:MAG: PAS domain S-box protein, partial [Deltaproteobacteria bacterium]|nr:PAS domain S-box protein [Deltaproteobacteria bacterium]